MAEFLQRMTQAIDGGFPASLVNRPCCLRVEEARKEVVQFTAACDGFQRRAGEKVRKTIAESTHLASNSASHFGEEKINTK